MLDHQGRNNPDGSFDWKDALIDAGISAGLGLCSMTGAMLLKGPLSALDVQIVLVAAAGQFLAFLAMKRKIVKKE